MRVHFLGIGGSGTSAAAAIAKAQGFEISGCDIEPHTEFTEVFDKDQLFTGHSAEHLYCHPKPSLVIPSETRNLPSSEDPSLIIQDDRMKNKNDKLVDILAVTPAIFSLDPNNSELLAAKEKGIPIMTWQQFTGEYLAKEKFVIAVCGTHGKTTTTAMIAELLEDAGLDPTVELGGIIPRWKTNFKVGKGKYFVVEADEFNDNFLAHKPDITVVTNIEMDHPEYFEDINAVLDSFEKFLLQTKKIIIANLMDVNIAEIVKDVMKASSLTAVDFTKNELGFDLKIPGAHNILNAKAAMQLGIILEISTEIIKKTLSNYIGVGRRFEYLGNFNGANIYSDFGHHPTEIKTTMESAREKFPDQRILLIYQPHMFSRTKALFNNFVEVFQNLPADKIFITDIYPSREIDTGIVNSKQLTDAIKKNSVEYIGDLKTVLEKIKPEIKPNDIIFFMGAGDIDKIARELVN